MMQSVCAKLFAYYTQELWHLQLRLLYNLPNTIYNFRTLATAPSFSEVKGVAILCNMEQQSSLLGLLCSQLSLRPEAM